MKEEQLIVFYDSNCPFCVGWVKFLLDRDGNDRLRFAALQGEWANRFFKEHNLKHPGMESLVVWDQGFLKVRSDATIALAEALPGIWSMGRHVDVFPRRFRDQAYDMVAGNRYKLFGKYDECWVPKSSDKWKFLDLETAGVHDAPDGDQAGDYPRPE
jgi:predicted DCC family thiol-disulfide oxidoreductase YuxK